MAGMKGTSEFHRLIEQVIAEYAQLELRACRLAKENNTLKGGQAVCDVDANKSQLREPSSSFADATATDDSRDDGAASAGLGPPVSQPIRLLLPALVEEGGGSEEGALVIPEASAKATDRQMEIFVLWETFVLGLGEAEQMHVPREFWDKDEKKKAVTTSYESLIKRGVFEQMKSCSLQLTSDSSSQPQIQEDAVLDANRTLRRASFTGTWAGGFWMLHGGSNLADWCSKLLTLLVVAPYSWRRVVWVAIGIVFMGMDLVSLSMSVFGVVQPQQLEQAALVYWTADIFASFLTGVYVNNKLELHLPVIAKHYMARWFSFDLLLVLAQWAIFVLDTGSSGNETQAGIFRYVRFGRYIRLLRLAKFDRMCRSAMERINSLMLELTMKVAEFLVAVLLWVHLSGSAWYWVGQSDEDGWSRQNEEFRELPYSYLVSVHWAVSQLQGNVDIYPGKSVNKVISDTAEYGCYLYTQACMPLLKDFMAKVDTGIIGTKYNKGDNGVDNQTLVSINEAIASHPVEIVGKELRGYMTAMKKIAAA